MIIKDFCENAATRRRKIVLCGYYGRGNFGDEAILAVLKQKIGEVLKEGRCKTSKRHAKLELCCISRTHKGSANNRTSPEIYVLTTKNPLKIIKILRGAELFVFGGGSLLQNSTSDLSLLYYITVIRLARLLARRTVMLSNGFGPIE